MDLHSYLPSLTLATPPIRNKRDINCAEGKRQKFVGEGKEIDFEADIFA